jgi:hypothetical protein
MDITQVIRTFKKTITFTAAGVEKLVFDRELSASLGTYQTYLGENVDTAFTRVLIDPVDSGINGAYCIETDEGDTITVDNTSFDDSVKRFQSTDVVIEDKITIRRLRVYADRAGSIDIILEQ